MKFDIRTSEDIGVHEDWKADRGIYVPSPDVEATGIQGPSPDDAIEQFGGFGDGDNYGDGSGDGYGDGPGYGYGDGFGYGYDYGGRAGNGLGGYSLSDHYRDGDGDGDGVTEGYGDGFGG